MKILLLNCFILVSFLSHAEYQKAKIELKDGDKIWCAVSVIERDVIVSEDQKLKVRISGEQSSIPVKKISKVVFDTIEYVSIKYVEQEYDDASDDLVDREYHYLVKPLVIGGTELYAFYKVIPSSPGSYAGNRCLMDYMIRNSNYFGFIYKSSFKSTMKEVYSGCETMLNDIKVKKYKFKDLVSIVEESNKYCKI